MADYVFAGIVLLILGWMGSAGALSHRSELTGVLSGLGWGLLVLILAGGYVALFR